MTTLLLWAACLGFVSGAFVNSTFEGSCSAGKCDCSWGSAATRSHNDGSYCSSCCSPPSFNSLQTQGSSCSQQLRGIDCTGNDISNQPGSSVDECCDVCAQKSGCNAFTYRYNTCWFKSGCPDSSECDDCIAGLTGPAPAPPPPSMCTKTTPGIDCTGHDISNKVAASTEECCSLCTQTSGCAAFSYWSGKCYFKSGCPVTNACSSCVVGSIVPAPAPSPPGPPFAAFSGVQSTSDLTNLLTPIKDSLVAPDGVAEVITVDTNTRFQEILGFGGAFTEAAAINFASLSAADQENVLTAYFAPPEQGGNGYTVGRVHMNSCDFSVTSYSFDDVAGDTSMSKFDMNVTHDQKTMLPFMRRALAKAPGGVKIFASPWSPPAWMKTNGKMTGSGDPGLRAEDQAAWALYFSKFFTAYGNSGVKLWGLTVQNEPGYAAPWEACKYSAAQERDFVKNHLGPVMRRDHPDAKIMVLDHNRDMVPEWTSTIFGDADAAQYVDGLALHWYDSHSAKMYANVQAAHDQYLSKLPNKFILGTEACNCPGVKLRDWERAWSIASDILGDLNAWAVGWTDWNLIVNHEGGPNHLGNLCDANIVADPGQVLGAGTVIKQVSYYLMGHFSRYLQPGMVRVKSDAPSNLAVTAFQDPTTKRTAVLVMNAQTTAANFVLQDKVTNTSKQGLFIPPQSIQTFVYTAMPTAEVIV